MDKKYFGYLLVFCWIASLAQSLSIHNATRKPRVTKYMTTTPEPITTEAPVTQRNQPLYRVITNTGTTCILLTMDAIVECCRHR